MGQPSGLTGGVVMRHACAVSVASLASLLATAAVASVPLRSLGTTPQGDVIILLGAATTQATIIGAAGDSGGIVVQSTTGITQVPGFGSRLTMISGDGSAAIQTANGGGGWRSFVWFGGQTQELPRPASGASARAMSTDGRVIAGFASYAVPNVPGFTTLIAARWTRTLTGWSFASNPQLAVAQAIAGDGTIAAAGPGPQAAGGDEMYAALWRADGTIVTLPNIVEQAPGGSVTPLAMTAAGDVVAGVTEISVFDEEGEPAPRPAPVVWRSDANGAWSVQPLPPASGASLPPPALLLFISDGGGIVASDQWVWRHDGRGGYLPATRLADFLIASRCMIEGWADLRLVNVSADGQTFYGYGQRLDAPGGPREEGWVVRLPSSTCDDLDFNNDGVVPSDDDVIDFFAALSGAACPAPLPLTCDGIDFNGNGVYPEDQDVIDFFTVLAGGTCQ